jgi:hypothetical protein
MQRIIHGPFLGWGNFSEYECFKRIIGTRNRGRGIPPYIIERPLRQHLLIRNPCPEPLDLPGKERSLKLFPMDNPNQWDQAVFPAMTREVFAEAIGNIGTRGSQKPTRDFIPLAIAA